MHPDPREPLQSLPSEPPEEADETVGFQNSPRRIAVELLVIVALIVGLGWGAVSAGGAIAVALTPLVSTSLDQKLGELGSQQAALLGTACPNPEAQRYVEELAAPLLTAAGELPFEFQFRVADDPSVNAFALPGGFVTVNRGLLESAKSGEEIAGVLAHEIQHALLRHGTKNILRQMGGSALLVLVTGGSDVQGLARTVGGVVSLGHDRDQESEADAQGLVLLQRAGIDPQGLADLFARWAEDDLRPPALLSTHPDPGDRAERIAEAARGAAATVKLRSPSGVRCQ